LKEKGIATAVMAAVVVVAIVVAGAVVYFLMKPGAERGAEDVKIKSPGTYNISAAVLDSTHAIIAYSDLWTSDYGTARVATISGSTISYGAEYVFNSADILGLLIWVVAVIIIVCVVALVARRAFRLLKGPPKVKAPTRALEKNRGASL